MLDVGTIWHHCHVMEATNHISKGLFGLIVVYPRGWTWEELLPDPLNVNTKANVTNAKGETLGEDVVIMSEKMPAPAPATEGDSAVGLVAAGGAAGGIQLANFRAWNDPYLIGPFRPGQKALIHVANIGETGKSWHLHGHHWYRLWQIWHEWQGYPTWTQTNEQNVTPGGTKAGPFDPNPFTPVAELAHTRWISSGEIMPILLRAEKPGMWFGHDHVVPSAYLGMIPWLIVEQPAGTPAAAKQEATLQQMRETHASWWRTPSRGSTCQSRRTPITATPTTATTTSRSSLPVDRGHPAGRPRSTFPGSRANRTKGPTSRRLSALPSGVAPSSPGPWRRRR